MAEPEEESQPLWSLEKLRMMARGNEVFVARMQQIFIDQTASRVTDIERAMFSGDFAIIGELAHKMKPGLDSFCVYSLKETVRMLEKWNEYSTEENNLHARKLVSVCKLVLEEMNRD